MKIRIIAAVLDTKQLTLYREDGEQVHLPQGDARIRGILDTITPIISRGGVAEIRLEPKDHGDAAYAKFEKKTNGLVRLFRVAKDTVKHLFSTEEERAEVLPSQVIGTVPVSVSTNNPSKAAINDIMAHATPVNSKAFAAIETRPDQTIVAVVDNKIVPGVEALKGQFGHAAKLGSTTGVSNLLTRLGSMIDSRGHSVEDVLRFMERGDLPVADDGSIIAYKILSKHSTLKYTFVDCHTKLIPQKVGSVVRVAEALVDRNRRNECSNGLHIARRGYLGSFPGDVCVLVKIQPEDVITVPHGDANKVRVCAYHILAVLPASVFSSLKRNQPMTDNPEARSFLDQAISGKHVGQLEQVLVQGQSGTNIQITSLLGGMGQQVTTAEIDPNRTAAVSKAATAIDISDPKKPVQAPAVDPKKVSDQVLRAKGKILSPRMQKARDLVLIMMDRTPGSLERYQAAIDLQAHKKAAKVSYAALGLAPFDVKNLEGILSAGEPLQAPTPAPVPIKLDHKAPAIVLPAKVAQTSTRQGHTRYLANVMMTGKTVPARERAAKDLLAHKKQTKVAWTALGLTEAEVKEVTYLTSPSKPATAPKPPKAKPTKKVLSVSAPKPAPTVKVVTTPPVGSSRIQIAQFYWGLVKSAVGSIREQAARDLLTHKNKSKLGWLALDLPTDAGKTLETILGRDN